jgi:prephenate dehydrogenase
MNAAHRGDAARLGRIAIIGAGQIGTMIGMALRQAGCEVAIGDRDPSVAETSVGLGAASAVLPDLGAALRSDTIILAVPVPEIVKIVTRIGPRMNPGSFLVDTGSAKSPVMEAMGVSVPPSVHAIGGHPMAGNEHPGPTGARPEMLRGAAFLFCEVRHDRAAREAAHSLASLVGAEMTLVDAHEHDAFLARTSHVAHVVAFVLASLQTQSPSGTTAPLSSRGYASAIRLAHSDPEMVAGFLHANAVNVGDALEEVISKLQDARRLLEREPSELQRLFEGSRVATDRIEAGVSGTSDRWN